MSTAALKDTSRGLIVAERVPTSSKTALRARKLRVAIREDLRRVSRPLRRIVVGIDFSAATDTALASVLAATAGQGPVVELVYVVDVFTEMFMLGSLRPRRTPDVAGGEIHAGLAARVRAARAQGARCISTILVGLPGLALVNHAERTDADLLVLGLEPLKRAPRAAVRRPPKTRRSRSSWVAVAARRIARTPGWRPAARWPGPAPELPISREIS